MFFLLRRYHLSLPKRTWAQVQDLAHTFHFGNLLIAIGNKKKKMRRDKSVRQAVLKVQLFSLVSDFWFLLLDFETKVEKEKTNYTNIVAVFSILTPTSVVILRRITKTCLVWSFRYAQYHPRDRLRWIVQSQVRYKIFADKVVHLF